MATPSQHRLQAVLRDLVALSAIPAVWVGSEPPAVAAGLADALVDLLQPDFVFVRLSRSIISSAGWRELNLAIR